MPCPKSHSIQEHNRNHNEGSQPLRRTLMSLSFLFMFDSLFHFYSLNFHLPQKKVTIPMFSFLHMALHSHPKICVSITLPLRRGPSITLRPGWCVKILRPSPCSPGEPQNISMLSCLSPFPCRVNPQET